MQNSREILITPPRRFGDFPLKDVWEYRELVYFFVWRDVKVRYKQTFLGVLWTVVRPLLSMGIFTFVFSTLAGFKTRNVPYPLLTLSAVLIWSVLSEGISGSTQGMLNNPNLITKVYFPRIIIPLAAVFRTMVDFSVALCLYLLLSVYYQFPLTWNILALPLIVLTALTSALGFGLWTASVSVKYRDIAYALPFVLQLFFWISPVGYSSANVPPSVETLYWLNPFVGVIESFRYCLTGSAHLPGNLFALSLCLNFLILLTGIWNFQRMENEFADVI